jgi:DNA-directed RNA polymerase subunit K/omega
LCRSPIPLFDPDDDDHAALVTLARQAEQLISGAELPSVSFQAQRRALRQILDADPVGRAIEDIVAGLLGRQPGCPPR